MSRLFAFVCVSLFAVHPVLQGAGQLATAESTPVTITATIEVIDNVTRTVTLKGPKGSVDVKAPDQMEGFNTLRVGDQVTVSYFEALAVNVRKQGAPPVTAPATTTTQRKENTPGSETRREQTFTVTVTAVDPKAPSLTAKGPQGRVVTFAVKNPEQLQAVRVGDTVDVTYYESLMVKVARK